MMKYDPAETLHCHALVEAFSKAVSDDDLETAKQMLCNIVKGAEADIDRFLSNPNSPEHEIHRYRIKTLTASAFVICEASVQTYCPENSDLLEFISNREYSCRALNL